MEPVLSAGWTLNCEALFYVLFAIGLLTSARRGIGFVTIVIAALVGLHFAAGLTPEGNVGRKIAAFWTMPLMLFFVVGLYLGWARVKLAAMDRLPRMPLSFAWFVAAIVTGIVLVDGWLSPLGGRDRPLVAFGAILLVAVAAFTAVPADRSRAQERLRAATALLGGASYCIYLFHAFVIIRVTRWLLDGHGPAWVTTSAIATLASTAIGIAMYKLVEVPTLRLVRRWTHLPQLRVQSTIAQT